MNYLNTVLYTPSGGTMIATPAAVVRVAASSQGAALDSACYLGEYDEAIVCMASHPRDNTLVAAVYGSATAFLAFIDSLSMEHLFDLEWKVEYGEPSALCYSHDGAYLAVAVRAPASLFFVRVEGMSARIVGSVVGLLPDGVPLAPHYFLSDPTSPLSDEPGFIVEAGTAGVYVSAARRFRFSGDDMLSASAEYSFSSHFVPHLSAATCADFVAFSEHSYVAAGYPDSTLSLLALVRSPDHPVEQRAEDLSLATVLPTQIVGAASLVADGAAFPTVCFYDTLTTTHTLYYTEVTRRQNIPLIVPKDAPTTAYGVSAVRGVAGGSIYVMMRGGLLCSFYVSRADGRGARLEEVGAELSEGDERRDPAGPPAGGNTFGIGALPEDVVAAADTAYLSVLLNYSACTVLALDDVLSDCGKTGSAGSVLVAAAALVEESLSWSEARSQVELLSLHCDRTELSHLITVAHDAQSGSAYPLALSLPAATTRAMQVCTPQPLLATFVSVSGLVSLASLPQADPLLRQTVRLYNLGRMHGLSDVNVHAGASRSISAAASILNLTSGVGLDASGVQAGRVDAETLTTLFGPNHSASSIATGGKQAPRMSATRAQFALSTQRFVMATADGIIRLCSYAGAAPAVLASVKVVDSVLSVSISPAGDRVAATCTDCVRIFSQDGAYLVTAFEIPLKMTTLVRYSAGGGMLCVVRRHSCSIFDTLTNQCVALLEGHNDAIVDVAFAPGKAAQDSFIITAAADGMVYLWTRRGERVGEIIGRVHVTSVSAFERPADGTGKYPFVLINGSGLVLIGNFNTGLVVHRGALQTPDGSYLAVKSILYDDCRALLYCGDSDGYVHSTVVPAVKDLLARAAGAGPAGSQGSQGSQSLQPPIEPLRLGGGAFCMADCRMTPTGAPRAFGKQGDLTRSSSAGVTPPRSPSRAGQAPSSTASPISASAPPASAPPSILDGIPAGSGSSDALEAPSRFMPARRVPRPLDAVQQVPGGPALALAVSPDRRVLLVSGLHPAGVFALVALPGPHRPGVARGPGQAGGGVSLDDAVTVDANLLGTLRRVLATLTDRSAEAALEYEHTLRVVGQRHAKALEAERSLAAQEVEHARARTRHLVQSADAEAEQYEAELAALDRAHSAALEKLESQYRLKVAASGERQAALKAEISAAQGYLADTLGQLGRAREQRVEGLIARYDCDEEAVRGRLAKLDEARAELRREYAELLRQADEDADIQVEELRSRYRAQLEELRIRADAVQAETGMIKNKFSTIEKSILTYSGSVAACDNTLAGLGQASAALQAEVQQARAEVEARNEAIVSRERLIYNLKREAKELEKHRFVLDFKIKELRKCIEPREHEISDLREQKNELGVELESYHKAAAVLENAILGCRAESSQLKGGLHEQKLLLQAARTLLAQMECDVCSLVERHGSMPFARLQAACRTLFDRYGGVDAVDKDSQAARDERVRHQQYLLKSIHALNRELQSTKDQTNTENARIVNENSELLKEAAVLRREIQKILHGPITQQNSENSKVFAARLTAQEAEIKRLKKRIVELQNVDD